MLASADKGVHVGGTLLICESVAKFKIAADWLLISLR